MAISSSDMKLFAVIILMFNTFSVFSQIPHEVVYVSGCFVNGTAEIHFEFDGEEILYVYFPKNKLIYTVPTFIDPDPSQLFADFTILKDAQANKNFCLGLTAMAAIKEKHPPVEKDPPEVALFTSEDVQLGAENNLICFVNHFYPPFITVSWTKNGRPVSEGVSLSQYYSNYNGTFNQFSTLTFTPSERDIYSCTVEHESLEMPKTRIWEHDFIHQSVAPDIVFGVGVAVGLLGLAAGVFCIMKAHHGQ